MYTSDTLSYTPGTRIPRIHGFRNYLKNYFAMYQRLTRSRIHVKLAYPGYLDFGVHLIVKLLPHDRLDVFLCYVELATPTYLGLGIS